MQLHAGTDAGRGVRGHVGMWVEGGEARDTHTHRNTQRNVQANVASTLRL